MIFGDQFIISKLISLVITIFLLITTPNTCGFILWLPNLVSSIFLYSKKFVETSFQTKIKSLCYDNSGEFIDLKSYLLLHDISYHTTAPHTLQQNDVFELWHRHVAKTGITLLHDASLALSYLPRAFQTASNLIIGNSHLLSKTNFYMRLFLVKKLIMRKFMCSCYALI